MPVTEILKFYKETEASRVGLCRQEYSLFQMVFCFSKAANSLKDTSVPLNVAFEQFATDVFIKFIKDSAHTKMS